MKKLIFFSVVSFLFTFNRAAQITAVPGPDDQGGMIMPMVTITATSGPAAEPTAGTVNVTQPSLVPELKTLAQLNPGDWFAETAAWRNDISPVDGTVPDMPSANAGNGDLFSNRYGFMFMAEPMMDKANVPTGNSLAIRLNSVTTPNLKSFNYGNADNRWDQVFDGVNSQVLWNGSMWHNYFTMPADTTPGTYTAEFEIFIADTPFTGSTGFAQYDAPALTASKNPNFTSAFVTYDFAVIPEPGVIGLLFMGLFSVYWFRSRRL